MGLSDPNDPNFQEKCTHEHALSCPQYDDIPSCLHKLQQTVKDSESLRFYSKEQKGDFLYDIEKASDAIVHWKAHVMKAVNQECTKQDILAELGQNSCLLVMDCAMKLPQLRYREKETDWHGKRGLSWHITNVVT